MFDFMRWRRFLSERAGDFRCDGFTTELRLSDHSPKPGTTLNVSGHNTLAYFTNWNTGEVDYEIMDTNDHRISSTTGLLLDDDTFQGAFNSFAEAVRGKFSRPPRECA